MKKQFAVLFFAAFVACKKENIKKEESPAPVQAKSWKVVNHDSTKNILRVLFRGSEYGYFISDGNYLLRTKNGGKTFSALALPVNYMLLGATLIDSTSLILTYNYNTFRTTDGGETWTAIETSSMSTALFDGWFVNANLGYLGGKNCILKTTDGGSSWQKLEIGNGDFTNIKFTSTNTGWSDNGSGVAFRTTDGGNTWTPHPTGFTSNAYMFFLNDQIAWAWQSSAMSFGVLLKRTTDGGATWETIFSDGNSLPWTCLVFQSQDVGFSGTLGGGRYSSVKVGTSWHSYQIVDNRALYNFAALSNGNLWGAGEQGLIMKYE